MIHLIANQKHLPLVVPITSIHVSSDGSYPIGHNEMPVMEKQIPSYSERPVTHQKPPAPYGPAGGYPRIEQEKSGYVEDEKVILQQLNAKPQADGYAFKEPQYEPQYKEPEYKEVQYKEPEYVIHQDYTPPDLLPPPPPETSQYPVTNDQQVIEQVKVTDEYPQPEVKGAEYTVQQEIKGNEYTVQQEAKGGEYPAKEEVKGGNYPIEQVKEIPQIQQITTEYVKQEEPKQQIEAYSPPPAYVQEAPKDAYPTQEYQVKGVEEYGRRVPAINYQTGRGAHVGYHREFHATVITKEAPNLFQENFVIRGHRVP